VYGPPPDPRQILLDAGPLVEPWAWALCLLLCLLLWALAAPPRLPGPLRGGLFIVGAVVLLTAPALPLIDRVVLGSFPTLDKEGSLLFYLDGVHRRLLAHPIAATSDPAVRLIGVHVGHLWVTELFDLVLSPLGAFNAQGLLNLALGWGCMAWLCSRMGAAPAVALALALPFGMGLHVMRDLNWATIEKSAVFWLPLFALALHRAWQGGPGGARRLAPAVVFGLMTWMNLYFGLVAAALGALALAAEGLASLRQRQLRPQTRDLALACLACALPGLLLAGWQAQVMASGPALASPERFLWERAALDGFSLSPFRWNRLEVWRALDPVSLALAAVGLWRARRDSRVVFAVGAALLLALLSVGPVLWPRGPLPQDGVLNPLFMAAWKLLPGFDRVAKPEVFFEASWLLLLGAGALGLRAWRPGKALGIALVAAAMLSWLLLVRSHPVYPPFSAAQGSSLDAGWQERVFPAESGP
jgi:hypothetical protein